MSTPCKKQEEIARLEDKYKYLEDKINSMDVALSKNLDEVKGDTKELRGEVKEIRKLVYELNNGGLKSTVMGINKELISNLEKRDKREREERRQEREEDIKSKKIENKILTKEFLIKWGGLTALALKLLYDFIEGFNGFDLIFEILF